MWMDDLRRTLARKAKAEALPSEVRAQYQKQYATVCREAVLACVCGLAEGLSGAEQAQNAQLMRNAGLLLADWEANNANGVIIRMNEVCLAAKDAAYRAGCVDTDAATPFSEAEGNARLLQKYIAIASACDAYAAAFARDCEDFSALELAKNKLQGELKKTC